MVKNDPRARLLALSEEQGVSLAALSTMLSRNSSYLQQFVRKGSPRKLEETDRRRLASFFGVDEAELGAPEDFSSVVGGPRTTPVRGDFVDVPRLALDASAGAGAFAAEELPYDTMRFSARWLRGQGLEPGQLSLISVAGDSMEPLLRDGDEILVDRTPRPVRDGVHVVRVGDTLMVKRVQTGLPGRIVLESANPAYRPIELTPAEVQVVGRVVWKGGRL